MGLASAIFAEAGCQLVYGLEPASLDVSGGAGHGGSGEAGGPQGGGGEGGAGGAGGSGGTMCVPMAAVNCYDGAPGTEGKGECKGGVKTCMADGSGFGPCAGEVVPSPENCASMQDQDCNGTASQCTGTYLWSKRYGNANSDQHVHGIAFDAKGNALLTGQLAGTVDFGKGPVEGTLFIAKVDESGNTLLSRGIAGGIGRSITSDTMNSMIVTGTFIGPIDFGGGIIEGSNSETIFLTKLDADGNHMFSKKVAPTAWAFPLDMATDAQNNIFICGYFHGPADFGGGPLVSGNGNDAFLAKFDSNGNYVYALHLGAMQNQHVAVDGVGNAVIVGGFSGTVDFGDTPLTASQSGDMFVARVSPTGKVLYAKNFGPGINIGSSAIMAYAPGDLSVAADSTGNVIIAGGYSGSISFGGSTLTSMGNKDIFVAKLDPMGEHVWSKSFGSAGDQVAGAVAVDAFGNPVMAGIFTGSLDFMGAGKFLFAGANQEVFATKLDTDGNVLWVAGSGGTSKKFDTGVAVSKAGDVLVSGSFLGPISFGADSLPTMGHGDVYVARLNR